MPGPTIGRRQLLAGAAGLLAVAACDLETQERDYAQDAQPASTSAPTATPPPAPTEQPSPAVASSACPPTLGARPDWPQPEKLPNIILVMPDDLGWHETGYNGHPHVKTPTLDEMAAQGLRLEQFRTTGATCSPTRASVLTGRHPIRSGTLGPSWSLRPGEETIAHVLSRAGYATGHFGKWHVGPVKASSPTSPGAMGFGEWLSHDSYFDNDPQLSRNGGPPELYEGESSAVIVDATLDFIDRSQGAGLPFFAVVWFGSPHLPYRVQEKDRELYAETDFPAHLRGREVRQPVDGQGNWDWEPLDDVLERRYAEISAMDREIGRLRKHLTEIGARSDTLIWFNSDNGVTEDGVYGLQLRGKKFDLYDGGIRVPAILEWPGVLEPRSSTFPTTTNDILPTLCELTGQALPGRPLDGISVLPGLTGEIDRRPDQMFFWDFDRDPQAGGEHFINPLLQRGTTPLRSHRRGRYEVVFWNFHHREIAEEDFTGVKAILEFPMKLILEGRGAHAGPELFDVIADPDESENLASDHPEMVARLSKDMRCWQESVMASLVGPSA